MEEKLKAETMKWLETIKAEKLKVRGGGEYFIKNIDAYISDSEHFLEKKDVMRAFEAVVWAWAYMEIGKELGKITSSGKAA